MKKLIVGFVCVFALILGVSNACASEDAMYDFYNGLADILETGMTSPQNCVVEAEKHIKTHVAPMLEAAKKGQQAAQAQVQKLEQVDMQQTMRDGQKALEDLMKTKGFQAMNRFMNAMQQFAQQYPDYAEKIMESMAVFETQ